MVDVAEQKRKYKLAYWKNGDKLIQYIEAVNVVEAKAMFYLQTSCDDIFYIEDVTADVV